MTTEILIGLVMLIVMIGAIFIGIQISFTLLFLALAFGYLALGRVVFDLAYFQTIGLMKEEVFAAVPLFIFMGFITEQAGLMERLFSALRMLSSCGSIGSQSSAPAGSAARPSTSAHNNPCFDLPIHHPVRAFGLVSRKLRSAYSPCPGLT